LNRSQYVQDFNTLQRYFWITDLQYMNLKGAKVARKIFVNLPVRDLRKSMTFFGKLGFTFTKQFTDERSL